MRRIESERIKRMTGRIPQMVRGDAGEDVKVRVLIRKTQETVLQMDREELIENLARDDVRADLVTKETEETSVLKEDGVVAGSRIVGRAQQGSDSFIVLCPERGDEMRSTDLCKSCCAYQYWADEHARKVRENCPVWNELKDKDLV
jgi:hypothetical protein